MMKIRIKYKGQRTTIDIDANNTLQQLREKCQHILPPTSLWYFSLNGSEPITQVEDSTLLQLGLVGGDLLHIVEEDGGSGGCGEGDLKDQLSSMGFPKVNIDKVVDTFGANTIQSALELLSMFGESSGIHTSIPATFQATSQVDRPSRSQSSAQMEIETSTISTNPTMTIRSCDLVSANNSEITVSKPLFLTDGITEQLKSLVDGVKGKTSSDYLFLIVHALIKESGLTLKRPKPNESTSPTVCEELPNGWRNNALGFYRLNYEYKGQASCSVTGTVTGKSMVVTGVVETRDDSTVDTDAHQVKLDINEYVDTKTTTSSSCKPNSVYKNMKKLSSKIKNEVTNKMIEEMRQELISEEGCVVGLNDLPEELKLRLLYYLNPKALCQLAQATREWRVLCTNNEIWRRLLFQDFGKRTRNSCYRLYKENFIERRELQKREEEMRNLVRPPLRPEFLVDMPDILHPQAQPRVPGMIGGRHDLYPADFPEINRPRNDPLRVGPPINPSQPGRIPGARFDPYGPMPDDGDEFGRSPLHPDLMQRPRFGRGNDFGGGGGGFGFM